MPKAHITYTDAEAKQLMRNKWPVFPENWMGTDRRWVRLLPFPEDIRVTLPYLHHPGGELVTNPDGMYGSFHENHVDLLVIDHCSSKQNFFDKRSRYSAAHDGLILALPRAWREEWHILIKGCKDTSHFDWPFFGDLVLRSRGSYKFSPWVGRPYRKKANQDEGEWKFSVRSIVCAYFLKPDHFKDIKISGNLFPRYEYIARHGGLSQITNQFFRLWLQNSLSEKQFHGK